MYVADRELADLIADAVVERLVKRAEGRPDLRRALQPLPGLTPREQTVAEALAQGLSNKEIAARLGISYEAVRLCAHRLYKKLGLHNRTEVARWVMDVTA